METSPTPVHPGRGLALYGRALCKRIDCKRIDPKRNDAGVRRLLLQLALELFEKSEELFEAAGELGEVARAPEPAVVAEGIASVARDRGKRGQARVAGKRRERRQAAGAAARRRFETRITARRKRRELGPRAGPGGTVIHLDS